MKQKHVFVIMVFVCLALLAVACSGPKPPKKVIVIQQPVQGQAPQGQAPQGTEQVSNPASDNCVQKGGTLTILKRGDGGEYGVCTFTNNMQCEEWAMFRGDCPVGGVSIVGYVTPAAVYCVINGGTYTVTSQANTQQEQGSCVFKNSKTCDATDFYNGKCSSEQ
jgi:hypothetical protein